MDFVFDADSYEDSGELPTPSAPLKLTNFQLQNDLTKQLSKLNILKSLNDRFSTDEPTESVEESQAFKYARNSLNLVTDDTPTTLHDVQTRNSDTSILSNRLSRVLNQNNYESSLRQSLNVLQTRADEYQDLTGTGTAGLLARRKLRGGVEEEILKEHYMALRRFQPIAQKLEYLQGDLEEVNTTHEAIESRLKSVIDKSSTVREKVGAKMDQRDVIRSQRALLASFKNNFTLNQYEEHYLQNEPVSEEFFKILDKVEQINDKCSILLSMENDSLGIFVMKQMSRTTDLATDRMTSYLKKNMNQPGRDAQSVALLQKSLIYIRKHSMEKFNSIVGDLIETRSRAIGEEFNSQLKGYSGHNRKISYMSSFDSKRFVSDLLAYVHSVIVNELELAESLFTFDQQDFSDELGLVIESVGNRVVGSLGRPLRAAVETSLRQEQKPASVINLCDLLELYTMMYGKLIDPEKSELVLTLQQLKTESKDRILALIQMRLKELRVESEAEEIDPDFLGIPDWLVEFYSNYMDAVDHKNELGLTDDEKDRLYAMLVDEPIRLLEASAKKLPLPKRSKMIFEINALDYIHSKIEVMPELSEKAKDVQEKLDELVTSLSKDQFNTLLKNSGLYDIYNLINMIFPLEDDFFDVSVYEPITENKLFNEQTFMEANDRLREFLATYITSDEFNNIISPTIVAQISVDPSVKFVKFYDRLLKIVDEYQKSDPPVFKWDGNHIATLLGVDDVYTSNDLASDDE